MNSVLRHSFQVNFSAQRALTYIYLTSWRQIHFQSRRQSLVFSPFKRGYQRKVQVKVYASSRIFRNLVPNFTQGRNYSSSIFVSDREKDISSYFSFDHDLEDRLSNLQELETNLKRRGITVDVEQLKKDYSEFMALDKEKSELESQRENIAKQIGGMVEEQKKSKVKSKEQVSRMKALSEEGKKARNALKELMMKYWDIEERMMLAALSLPSHLSQDAPDEETVLEEYFQERKPVTPVDHLEVLKSSGMVRLSNVGNKAYYLKGRLALLEQELVNHFSQRLRSKNITQMLAPEMLKTPIMEGSSLDVSDPALVYRLQHKLGTKHVTDWDTDYLFVRGASQLSFLSYFARTTVNSNDLPVKMFVVGSNYIPENSETEELPGLFGMLQTIKVSMCGFCASRGSSAEVIEGFTSILTGLYKQFELPFRLVLMPVSSLSAAEQNRIELQLWIPSLRNYLKLASVSMCGEYSSRRLMIRCSDGRQKSYPVNMVHCEVADITRIIGALVEYGQIDRQWGR